MDIGFTGNFIRFTEMHYPMQILFELLRIPIKEFVTGENFRMCFPTYTEKEKYKEFYSSMNKLDKNIFENWYLYQEENTILSEDIIGFAGLRKDFIIGFEIPPSICELLSKEKISYINFFIHPVRFLPDILFQVSTNNSEISKILRSWSILLDVNSNIDSDRIKRYCVKEKLKQDFIKPGTVAIFGQTAYDASVIKRGKFLTLNDFEDEIRQYTKNASNIVLVPHPYEKKISHLIQLIDNLGKGSIVNLNSYSLLCNENIDTVITLSSSIGREAEFFRKNIKYLLGESLAIGSSMIPSNAMVHSLGQVVFETEFWKEILRKASPHKEIEKNLVRYIYGGWKRRQHKEIEKKHFQEKNLLRYIYGGWAYNEICPNVAYNEERNWNIINLHNQPFNNHDLKVINLKDITYIDFSVKGNSFLYTLNGFSYPEEWGTWTDGDEVELKVPNFPGRDKGWIITLYGYINEKVEKQNFLMFIDDEFIGSATINCLEHYIIRIPLEDKVKSKREISIKFQLKNAISPFNLGLCQDKRNLALRFVNAHASDDIISKFEVVAGNEI